jgi:hypothetical protein
VFVRGDVLQAEVYGTQMLNDCPAELWDTLVANDITTEMGAAFTSHELWPQLLSTSRFDRGPARGADWSWRRQRRCEGSYT